MSFATDEAAPTDLDPAPAKSTLRVDDAPFIVKEVLRQVGRPETLFRIEAKRTWGNHYRVNMYCTKETGLAVRTVAITDSFFVTMTDAGLISDPPISPRYK